MYVAQRKYGCLPSRPHFACPVYAVDAPAPLTPVFSLRPASTPAYNQEQTSSCTGHASARVYELKCALQGKPLSAKPSVFFPYYNARDKEGTAGQDCGASIHDVAMALALQGMCSDSVWPFNPPEVTVKPPQAAYDAAKPEIGSQFLWVPQSLSALKTAIYSKEPLITGISVYESFESPQAAHGGRIPMPQYWEQLLGGHAIALIGWNDHIQCFEFSNSWGPGWGDHGFGWLPYSYVLSPNLAQDFGALKLAIEAKHF